MSPEGSSSALKSIEQIVYLIRRLDSLFKSRILWDNPYLIYRQSVFYEIIVHLNELLRAAENDGSPVSFTDDIRIDGYITNVSRLINYFKKTFCHDADDAKDGTLYTPFSERVVSTGLVSGQTKGGNKYADDIAFFAGDQTLYLKRHIERAYAEARVFFVARHKQIFRESAGDLFDEAYYNTAFKDFFA